MIRTASSEHVGLAHPVPDLQSLQGAYIQNVERLEEHAERLSLGSDIGEEIRKLQLEQKLSESRRASLRGSPIEDSIADRDARVTSLQRSRNPSTSSYTNSVNAARWGGYSPTASIRSGSYSQFSHHPSLLRRSSSKGSRFGYATQSPSSPTANSPIASGSVPKIAPPQPPPHRTLMDDYDEISSQLAAKKQVPPQNPDHEPEQQEEEQEHGHEHGGRNEHNGQNDQPHLEQPHDDPPEESKRLQVANLDVPDRPPSAASSANTYQQAQILFHDFDGIHYNGSIREPSIRESLMSHNQEGENGGGSRASSILRTLPAPHNQGQPPPGDDMIYYPAPVPRLLNLPKRLSQIPAAHVQARRRTKMLSAIDPQIRKSTTWLTELEEGTGEGGLSTGMGPDGRKSVDGRASVNMASLPPQLRASMFFEHQSVPQQLQMKGQSAVDTLDSILEASATAPVAAFVDHPYVGPVSEIYKNDNASKSRMSLATKSERRKSSGSLLSLGLSENRKSNTSMLTPEKEDGKKSERTRTGLSSFFGRKRDSSQDKVNKLKKKDSRGSLGPSRAVSSEVVPIRDNSQTPEGIGESTPLQGEDQKDDDSDPERESQADVEDEVEPELEFFGPPTTLLAELQMRKAQQKQRNRTAVQANPNGMHSTLLELDAVAQIEKSKRKNHRTALAWEDPVDLDDANHSDDEDVPLGVLFAGRGVLAGQKDDWNRPMGLIEKREMEDNEPLASRRLRLRGIDPRVRRSPNKFGSTLSLPLGAASASQLNSSGASSGNDEEGDGETLAACTRRLKLEQAVAGVDENRPGSKSFGDDLMNSLGIPAPQPEKAPTPVTDEEETLAQRRARLQRERQVSGNTNVSGGTMDGQRPQLKQRLSMGNLLSAHPISNNHPNNSRRVSNEQFLANLPVGSLLQQSEVTRERQKRQLAATNRQSSYGLGASLLDIQQDPSAGGMHNNYAGMQHTGMGMNDMNMGMGMGMGQMPYGAMGPMSPNPMMMNMPINPGMPMPPMQLPLFGMPIPAPGMPLNYNGGMIHQAGLLSEQRNSNAFYPHPNASGSQMNLAAGAPPYMLPGQRSMSTYNLQPPHPPTGMPGGIPTPAGAGDLHGINYHQQASMLNLGAFGNGGGNGMNMGPGAAGMGPGSQYVNSPIQQPPMQMPRMSSGPPADGGAGLGDGTRSMIDRWREGVMP
ncbi:hypothetical protein K402DRAFT_459203 [Aulographum hederae CBS 113979]|uniref:Uncharacterized protein n=1 Tax=Aulographum hederae CBS 113979 TaxID=1176131 RepID=A0A6G1HFN8_9PEZI|nr:hypothetical protein K402DRAFT_459203 [Aulographum hederae CBS 113979]